MNDFIKNVQQVWNGVPKNRRIPILVAALMIVAGLAAIITYSNKPNMAVLFGDMQPTEASKVVDTLKEKKIRYELADEGRTVKVPEADVYDLRLSFAAAGVPRASDTSGGVGFELLDKQSFGMSDMMQKANYYRAIQGELARTIKRMDDIDEASVMIVVPEERLFSKDRKEAKASVLLQLKQGHELNKEQVRAIRFLVSNSVEGLTPTHVAIVDTTGRSLAEDDSGNSLSSVTTTQLSVQQEYETHLKQKVQEMLDQTLGVGQSRVEISTDLQFDTIQDTSEKWDPKSAVVANENIQNEETHSKTQQAEAIVGTTPNVDPNANSDKNLTSSDTTKADQQNQYDVNREVESVQRATGVPTRITAAVVVNVRKAGTGATASVTPRTQQEKDEIAEIVKDAIGYTNVPGGRQDVVTVQEMEFAPAFAEEVPVDATSKVEDLKNRWMPYASQGLLIILAVAVLLYLRSILKSSTSFESDASGEFSSLLNRYKKMADDALAEVDRDKAAPAVLSVDELSKLIRDNPGNTSQAIKVWMMRN